MTPPLLAQLRCAQRWARLVRSARALRLCALQAEPEDALLLRRVDAPAARVALSEKDKAQHVQLTDDGFGAQSSKARSGGLAASSAARAATEAAGPGVPHRALHARRRHRRLVL